MKPPPASDLLPPDVRARLAAIAARQRRVSVLCYVFQLAGVFLVLAAAAMMADRGFRLFHPVWRWLASLTVIGGGLALAWRHRALAGSRLSAPDAARAAESVLPGLEERWSTLASPGDPRVRGAASLLARVRDEASAMAAAMPARTGISRPMIVRGAVVLGAGAGLAGLLWVSDPGAAGVRWQRVLAPWSEVSLTTVWVTPEPVPAVVPRHEVFELKAAVSGRPAPHADLLIRESGGRESVIRLAAGAEPGLFTHVLPDPREAFAFRFRAGDGQTPWHQVAVADRPVIASAGVVIAPPAYTGQPAAETSGIPPVLRALAGSTITVRIKPGTRGCSAVLRVRPEGADHYGQAIPGTESGGAFTWSWPLTASLHFQPVLTSRDGLLNQSPPVCALEVVPDRPPAVTLAAQSAAKAQSPSEVVEVAFTATDDVGIQKLELVVTLTEKGREPVEVVTEIPLGAEQGARVIDKMVPLDLSKLPLKPGMKISYAVRATDGRGAGAESGSGGPPKDPAGQPSDEKGGPGAKSPPVAMGTRKLDAGGQCSCSSNRNLEIEEFTGDSPAWREKESIPVLPVLERITAAVRQALTAAAAARSGLAPRTPMNDTQRTRAGEAAAKTRSAAGECEALTVRTADTPYQLIGLQLRELRERELLPAETALTASSAGSDPASAVGAAELHLRAALAWLERLTRMATAVQKQEAVEALAQKIRQMHRVFQEDSMKLLEAGGGGGPDRPELPLVEVSEEYARLLKERMEKLNALMKELAKLLESDPALRSRFLANKAKGSAVLQAQLQGLEQEQSALELFTGQLAETAPGPALRNVMAGITAEAEARYAALADELARILRASVTWMPKSVSAAAGPGQALQQALLAAASSLPKNPGAAAVEIDRAVAAADAISLLPGAADFAARRRGELTSAKMTLTWLDSLTEAAKTGKPGRVAELRQRDLSRRTLEFATKVEGGMGGIAESLPPVAKLAGRVRDALFQEALPAQRTASPLLRAGEWPRSRTAQRDAVKGLAAAAAAWRDLMRAVAEEMKKNPPPPDKPCDDPDMESLLAMMEREAAEMDDWGLPSWQLNVQIISDWQKQCSKPGSGIPQPSPAGALRAAGERERELAREAAKAQAAANAREEEASAAAAARGEAAAATGRPDSRRQDWNRLPSELTKDLRLQNDAPPPEEYRHAVEVYFRRIGVEPAAP